MSLDGARIERLKKIEKAVDHLAQQGTPASPRSLVQSIMGTWHLRERTAREYVDELLKGGRLRLGEGGLLYLGAKAAPRLEEFI